MFLSDKTHEKVFAWNITPCTRLESLYRAFGISVDGLCLSWMDGLCLSWMDGLCSSWMDGLCLSWMDGLCSSWMDCVRAGWMDCVQVDGKVVDLSRVGDRRQWRVVSRWPNPPWGDKQDYDDDDDVYSWFYRCENSISVSHFTNFHVWVVYRQYTNLLYFKLYFNAVYPAHNVYYIEREGLLFNFLPHKILRQTPFRLYLFR